MHRHHELAVKVGQLSSSPVVRIEAGHADGNTHLTDAERVAQSITSDFEKAGALAAIAGPLAASEPDRARLIADAERIAQSITDGFEKAHALAAIVGALAASDPDRVRLIADAERARPVHGRRRLPEGPRARHHRGSTGSH